MSSDTTPNVGLPLATLPAALSASEARALGLRPDRLVGRGLERVVTGRYVQQAALEAAMSTRHSDPASGHLDDLWRRRQVARATLLMPKLGRGAFYSHHTAGALWGLPVPRLNSEGLDVGYLSPDRGSRKSGIRPHRFSHGLIAVARRGPLLLTCPASTWVILAPQLGRADAVALGDAVLHERRYPGTTRLERQPLTDVAELRRLIEAPYRRARPLLSALLEMLSPHAASPPESRLRLLLSDWGLPEPTLDYDVRDNTGAFIGCSEFAFPEFRLAIEYEGDHHRTDARQWNRDIEKYRAYAMNGWEVVRVTSLLLYRRPDELRRLLEEALRRRSGR